MAAATTTATSTSAAPVADDDEDEDCFFESLDRVPSSVSFDLRGLASSPSDSDADDARTSFASAVAPPLGSGRYSFASSLSAFSSSADDRDRSVDEDYGMWIAEPLSVEERRRRLLQGMGLASRKDLPPAVVGSPGTPDRAPPASSSAEATPASSSDLPSPPPHVARSKSDAGAAAAAAESARVGRLAHLLGASSPPRSLVRAMSAPPCSLLSPPAIDGGCEGRRVSIRRRWGEDDLSIPTHAGAATAAGGRPKSRTIRDLDTGKEFVIDELLEDGTWNRLCDPETGLRLTIEEFERSLGYSPIVRELMRRVNVGSVDAGGGKNRRSGSSTRSRGVKKGIGWLKNIRGVANSVSALMQEKEREFGSNGRAASPAGSSSSEWMKVRQRRKPYKELTGLYLCQEIRAHQGSIWTIKFSPDAQLLASAGEDRVIHVWQVADCDGVGSSSQRSPEEAQAAAASPVSCSMDRSTPLGSPGQSGPLDVRQSQRLRGAKILSSRNRSSVPDHIVPGTVFSLSKKPVCSFHGHLDDVLDLSWSKSQYLLSSSMDKTVRLWDMESRTCIKLFAHNDYVTCIQFNPTDDRYFISGSLDAKVRIWSIPDRQVVDWTDLHEMVTAACYTPDGQGALVGSHKGSCRFYSTSDGKLHQNAQIEIQNKRRKSHARKITGFQFVPGNPSEVLITSADSQIQVFDGVDLIHKFRGFRNTSSQISASFTADGNYVVCASEDSNVYVWKREETHSAVGAGKGKSWVTTRSYEHFSCKDVSVAIPWPPCGSSKIESPILSSWPRQHNHQSPHRSPDSQQPLSSRITASEDVFVSCRSHCPPLPKKSSLEEPQPCLEEFLRNQSQSGSGIGSSSSISTSHWLMSGALSSISAFNTFTSFTSSRWNNGGGNSKSSNIPASTAWGLVVVTAGLGGEIKIYQNFGLPRLLSRQNHIF